MFDNCLRKRSAGVAVFRATVCFPPGREQRVELKRTVQQRAIRPKGSEAVQQRYECSTVRIGVQPSDTSAAAIRVQQRYGAAATERLRSARCSSHTRAARATVPKGFLPSPVDTGASVARTTRRPRKTRWARNTAPRCRNRYTIPGIRSPGFSTYIPAESHQGT